MDNIQDTFGAIPVQLILDLVEALLAVLVWVVLKQIKRRIG